ncbi:MAG TPA: hypothetical protein VH518_01630 [Tepidisphaeraceae bacterium]|jgi:hypothetical protein
MSSSRQTIGIGRPQGPRCPPAQYVQLMAENKILSFETAARLHKRRQPMQQQFDHPTCSGVMTRFGILQLNSCRMGFSVAIAL